MMLSRFERGLYCYDYQVKKRVWRLVNSPTWRVAPPSEDRPSGCYPRWTVSEEMSDTGGVTQTSDPAAAANAGHRGVKSTAEIVSDTGDNKPLSGTIVRRTSRDTVM
ncbi:hypothetical protein ACRE_020290 [Hapsidospora chrysogenum ATCC 11550]|uniref:Uncharacterized protein n=1 Tax=Hapsidospora chrysogenum (strain ATCC 11550 / CBS 779.69 / DSM 880 / IAM 14645 / JCM 23072 / IMI 49137) TaxID=857340 RepID=A0A086TCS2_HAPC1|nr:hypothetical protein ACRE_020290 [Hapsidospora chrysogenum ATCC 11550]